MIYNNLRWSEVEFNFSFNNLILITVKKKNVPVFNSFIYTVDLSWLSIYERKVIIR